MSAGFCRARSLNIGARFTAERGASLTVDGVLRRQAFLLRQAYGGQDDGQGKEGYEAGSIDRATVRAARESHAVTGRIPARR